MRIIRQLLREYRVPLPALICLLVATTLMGFSTSAFAEDDRERMIELNEKGFEAFSEERFEDAALAFEEAYAASPDPVLRKNEAIAWFKAGRCTDALTAANAFLLAENTPVEDKKEARSVVANCKVELARDALEADSYDLAETLLAEAESLEPDDYARDQIGMVRVEIAKARSAADDEEDVVLEEEDSGLDTGTVRTIGWVLAGTGAAITLGAIAYHIASLLNQSELQDISNEGGDRKRFNELQDSISTARWAVPTLYVVGLITGGSGATILILNQPEEAPPAAHLGMELPLAIGPAFQISF